MKVWCVECLEYHIDKDFRDDFPRCEFVDRRGFSMCTDDEKLRLWQLWMNPLYDELAVRYRLMVRGGAYAEEADVIMVDNVRVFYPKGYSAKWRRIIGHGLMGVAIRLATLGKRILGVKNNG